MEVIPSFYNVTSPGISDRQAPTFGQVLMSLGEVQRIIYPEDKDSRTKQIIEYDVLVNNFENKVFNQIVYKNCTISNLFGGLADLLSYTLRPDSTAAKGVQEKKTIQAGEGSKVLLMCLNGARDQAVIVGGIRDPKDKDSGAKDKGHNLHFNFNGVDISINKDGELAVVYQGATDAKGKTKVSKSVAGTSITLKKNGNLVAKTDKQSITINHEKGTIDISADKTYTVKAKDIKVAASGTVAITDNLGTSIKGLGLTVGAGTDLFLKGTTYRAAEAALNAQLIAAFTQIATFAPLFMMDQVSAGALAAVSAITAFEAGALAYLSLKNKSD